MLFRSTVALRLVLVFGPLVLVFGWMNGHAQEKISVATPAPIAQANAAFKDPSSYAMGFNIGSSLAQEGFVDKDLDSKDLMMGMLDALSKKEPKLTRAQFQEAMNSLQQRMQKKLIELAKSNLEKSNAYLDVNKKKDGVQTTRTGLQYQVMKTGTGKTPTVTDIVVCHYEGKLIDGFVFDSSIKKNQPLTLDVSKFVPGLTEAFQRMKVGDKWVITLPSDLGYGEPGEPRAGIGPNEALIFDVELLDVKK